MESMLTMKRPSPMTRISGLHIKLLAPPFEQCAKCGNMNSADGGTLWRVCDERGTAIECDICGTRTARG